MSAQKGRLVLIKVSAGGTPDVFSTVGGLRTKSLTVNNEQVDITESDTAPWRQLLGDAGLRSVSMSGTGVFKDDSAFNRVEDLSFTGALEDYQLVFGNGDYIQGQFQVASLQWAGDHDKEQQYDVTLESGGVVSMHRA
jgi:TP901-1 family phage major tail protein